MKSAVFGSHTYVTSGGVRVERTVESRDDVDDIARLADELDVQRGLLLTSSYEYPGRYSRWAIGFVNPPLCVVAGGANGARSGPVRLQALNERGEVLLRGLTRLFADASFVRIAERTSRALDLSLVGPSDEDGDCFDEEERTRRCSVFSVLRAITAYFASPDDPHLGLYGAFGHDLAFQFEPIRLRLSRAAMQRDLVLYLPDAIAVVDHVRGHSFRCHYEFEIQGGDTRGLARSGETRSLVDARPPACECDHAPGEYPAVVDAARAAFRRGDLFEVTVGQVFYAPRAAAPSELFRRLCAQNPSPYGFLANLGEGEHLVGASPEMFVRVHGDLIESCPIAGTVARGADAMEDARQIEQLLASKKDECELTMCTDVDRNDKARVCQPGSVRVVGRRQIELYSRVIHTVDHVEGRLKEGCDSLDAFIAHMWAVTVTGAPKRAATQFIEDHEKSVRGFYGGAVGGLGFDGHVNTGIAIRAIRTHDGVAEVRAGATLVFDSDPAAEDRETRMKAAALFDCLRPAAPAQRERVEITARPGAGKRVLLIDHHDSFVHTLGDYFRQTGARVSTLRAGFALTRLDAAPPDLAVLSPGPGRPQDFAMLRTLEALISRGIAVFGVCLGLQGLVEYWGGELDVLDVPVHGKPSRVRLVGPRRRLFAGLPDAFTVGRYHSLFARRAALPSCLDVTAETEQGVVMAVEHQHLPLSAVQFHPESILTLERDVGRRIIDNVVHSVVRKVTGAAS